MRHKSHATVTTDIEILKEAVRHLCTSVHQINMNARSRVSAERANGLLDAIEIRRRFELNFANQVGTSAPERQADASLPSYAGDEITQAVKQAREWLADVESRLTYGLVDFPSPAQVIAALSAIPSDR